MARETRGQSLLSLQIRNRFGLFVIAIKKHVGESFDFLPGPDHVIARDDVLVMIGRESDILRMREAPSEIEKVVAKNGRSAERIGSGDHRAPSPAPAPAAKTPAPKKAPQETPKETPKATPKDEPPPPTPPTKESP